MKIAVLTNAYPPKAQGGAGRIAFEYTKILEGLGHEVKVWGADEEFFELGKKSALARLFFHLKDLGAKKDIVEDMATWEPEVLFTHNLTGCGFGTASYLKRSFDSGPPDGPRSGRRLKWFHVLHDVQLLEPSGQIVYGESFGIFRKVWRWKWAWLRKMSLGEPDVVISPTKWLMEQHEKYGFFKRSKKVVVPNPVRRSGDLSTESIPHSDAGLETTRDEKQILFVGRLDSDKGIDLLLEAWPELKKISESLVVVGGGLRLEDFKKQFPEVEFKGELASEEVLKTMAQSGVLVVPSLVMENQPTVILEGLACGCKVVASDVGGVRETLGEAGWIFKPGSSDDLVRAVREAMVGRGDACVAQGKACLAPTQTILKRHDPGIVAGVLAGLLKSNL
ncbi:glycosyltransferase family 4 protein [Candidatus Uhrbacteria bacterium]|nr:glycosyltransferase family 4 protein [Candidatus Uhrbacteria bacterium]